MAQVKDQLGVLVRQGVRGGRLVIYVDNLERCDAKRALQVCEVASQVLAHEHVVVVMLADMRTVANAAAGRYLEENVSDIDAGRRFLEKIVQIKLALPPPRVEDMHRLLRGEMPLDLALENSDEAGEIPTDAPAVAARSGRLVNRAQRIVKYTAESVLQGGIIGTVVLALYGLWLTVTGADDPSRDSVGGPPR